MGTTPEQRTVTGTLGDIVARIREAGLTPPAITVVGDVVRMRDALSWFEDRPLFGKRVLITRTRKQASVLARLLADEGAVPVELPAIEIEPVADRSELDAAIGRLAAGAYAWTVFTSANAVEEFFAAVESKGLDARIFGATRVCTIGPATAAALAEHGIRADLVPAQYVAESVVEAMRPVILSSTGAPLAGRRSLREGIWRRGAREPPLRAAKPLNHPASSSLAPKAPAPNSSKVWPPWAPRSTKSPSTAPPSPPKPRPKRSTSSATAKSTSSPSPPAAPSATSSRSSAKMLLSS